MNYEKFISRMFQKCDGVVWDMMTGRLGIKTNDGIVSLELDAVNAEDSQITVNMLDDFGMPIPAFAQSTPTAAVNVGDMIYSSATGKPSGWVVKKTDKSFRLMKPDGTTSQWTPPKVQMLGMDSGVLVLRSLMNMLPGGQSGLGQLQSSLMPMMAMGMMGGEDDMSEMMPLMLMSQMGVQSPDGTANPLAGGGNMMQTMMMMQMMKKMGGGATANPFKASKDGKPSKGFFD
jgi:hypothetical protein